MKHRGLFTGMRLLAWLIPATLLAACASMGRPEGGPRDEDPPVFVRSNPMPGSRNVKTNKFNITFNENVQVEDAFNKVTVSPAQRTPPSVIANGRHLTIELRDTLLPNTTYTIDCADAIKDLNEGNILDGFAIDFSTGDTIDTLRISGTVLQAQNLEPAQGMLVGVYDNLSDTAITSLPLARIARTNQYGQFTIRNLKKGVYRIFALNDLNRDYHWDRSEDIAFYDTLISPSVVPIEVTDTLYSSTGEDSLVHRAGVRYLPNDILLSWFNENYRARYLAEYKRPNRRQISLVFGAPNDTLPRINIVSGLPGREGESIEEFGRLKINKDRDSLLYWLTDTAVVAADSLRLAVTYLKNDSLDKAVWTTDTLRFFFRDQAKKEKKKNKKNEEPKYSIDSITGDTIYPPIQPSEWLTITSKSSTQQELNLPLLLETNLPLQRLDTAAVALSKLVDTLWTPVPFKLKADSSDLLLRSRIDIPWEAGAKYRLTIDSLAATSIYGPWNKPFKHEFTVKQPEDYSNLSILFPGVDSLNIVVELLSTSDEAVYRATKAPGTDKAVFNFLNPGTYYARLFIDSNENGRWDTGKLLDGIQPEEVYYFAKKLELKKNWDIEQTWNIYELPVDAQKPYAIKKNKPTLKRGEEAPTEQDEEYDDDDMMVNPFDPNDRTSPHQRQGRGNYSSPSASNMRMR